MSTDTVPASPGQQVVMDLAQLEQMMKRVAAESAVQGAEATFERLIGPDGAVQTAAPVDPASPEAVNKASWTLKTGKTLAAYIDEVGHLAPDSHQYELEQLKSQQFCTELDDFGVPDHDGNCTSGDNGCLTDPLGVSDIGQICPQDIEDAGENNCERVRADKRKSMHEQRIRQAEAAGIDPSTIDLTVSESDLERAGRGAQRNFMAAARWLFGRAYKSGLIPSNPAAEANKPIRSHKGRPWLTHAQIAALIQWVMICSWDPILDLPLIWFHLETGARASEGLALRREHLHRDTHTITIGVEGSKSRSQPVSLALIEHLAWFATSRQSTLPFQKVFRTDYAGQLKDMSWSHYRGMWRRVRDTFDCARKARASTHCLRKTAGMAINRVSNMNVSEQFLGHTGDTCVGATDQEVAEAVSILLGYQHPLVGAVRPAVDAHVDPLGWL